MRATLLMIPLVLSSAACSSQDEFAQDAGVSQGSAQSTGAVMAQKAQQIPLLQATVNCREVQSGQIFYSPATGCLVAQLRPVEIDEVAAWLLRSQRILCQMKVA